jgi:predicted naringenin-chalcone synthase
MSAGGAAITGMAFSVPPARWQNDLWDGFFAHHLRDAHWARRIYDSAGVRRRHPAVDPTVEDISQWPTGARLQRYLPEAMPLAKSAATEALAEAGLDGSDLGFLAVVSCTGYSTPGVDLCLARDLGLRRDAERLLIGHMGCHAALPALGAVSDQVAAQGRPALLLCVELPSLHLQPASHEVDQLLAHALFSDAAAAVVVVPGTGDGAGLTVLGRQSVTDPASAEHITWDVTDLGFRMGLSRHVPDVLAREVGPAVDMLLARHGARREDVGAWAAHPGGLGVLQAISEALRLPPGALDISRDVLANFGNCSSATVLVVLEEMRRQGRLGKGRLAVALAFGPGLTLCAVLLRA